MRPVRLLSALAVVAALAAAPARADFLYTVVNDHADIELAFEDGQLLVETHFDTGPMAGNHLSPADVLFYATPPLSRQTFSGPHLFLDQAENSLFYLLPENRDAFDPSNGLPWLGVAVAGAEDPDEAEANPFNNGFTSVNLRVLGVTGPGNFAVWGDETTGDPFVKSTDLATFGSVPVANDHRHINWGFSAAGLYAVTVQAVGVQNGVEVVGDTTTINFGIEFAPVTAAPAPPTAVFAVIGLAAVGVRRLRRRA